jgi:hypothetical protein
MMYTNLSEVLILDVNTGNIIIGSRKYLKKIFTMVKLATQIFFDTTKIIMHLFINYLDSKFN